MSLACTIPGTRFIEQGGRAVVEWQPDNVYWTPWLGFAALTMLSVLAFWMLYRSRPHRS